jgi:2-hydroxycyclohexanecarboxyl-CoA dehydrogenase
MTSCVAVITGGAQGIGLAIAQCLAENGFRVALLDRDEALVEAAAAQFTGGVARGYGCDVTDFEALQSTAMRVNREMGLPRLLVSNAGIPQSSFFLETTIEEESYIVSVNLVGSFNATRAFLPFVQSEPDGRVVFIASDAGRAGVSQQSIYAATKAGLIGFAKSLALEVLRTGTTVNVVSPGTTDTPLVRTLYDQDARERRLRAHPQHRFATPRDVAEAVCFFASPGASFTTGQILSVNGGMLRAG